MGWEKGRKIKSRINPEILRALGYQTKYPFPCLLEQICKDVKHGANIGVKQECQVSSTSSNAPSAYEDGEKVSDELATWISKGFVVGPLEESEVPFNKVKISGLMTKVKPNGAVRPILNFNRGVPKAVNEGMDKNYFPTVMSSTENWVRILLRCGRGARFCKMTGQMPIKILEYKKKMSGCRGSNGWIKSFLNYA